MICPPKSKWTYRAELGYTEGREYCSELKPSEQVSLQVSCLGLKLALDSAAARWDRGSGGRQSVSPDHAPCAQPAPTPKGRLLMGPPKSRWPRPAELSSTEIRVLSTAGTLEHFSLEAYCHRLKRVLGCRHWCDETILPHPVSTTSTTLPHGRFDLSF